MAPADRKQRIESFTVVNAAIKNLACELEQEHPPLEWRFWCECGAPACAENVWLTLAAYEALRDEGRPLLAPGHEVDQRARARRLAEDAAALRAQAEHQVGRAARNRARLRAERDRPG